MKTFCIIIIILHNPVPQVICKSHEEANTVIAGCCMNSVHLASSQLNFDVSINAEG